MNKQGLINLIAEKHSLTKVEAGRIVDTFIDTIKETVASGESVSVAGFGKFERRQRAARRGLNPQTGKEMNIPESYAVGFKVAKDFKDKVKA